MYMYVCERERECPRGGDSLLQIGSSHKGDKYLTFAATVVLSGILHMLLVVAVVLHSQR